MEAGREGRTFTYRAESGLNLQPGDLVRVGLRGRGMHGLVVAVSSPGAVSTPGDVANLERIQPVQDLLQRAAVEPQWRCWLEGVAQRCHLSPFRMLKAALPAGWLGQARTLQGGRSMWWVERAQPAAGRWTRGGRRQR